MNSSLKLLLPFLLFASIFSCVQSAKKNHVEKQMNDSIQTGITINNLQGYWTCNEVVIDHSNESNNLDANEQTVLGTENWLIKGDTIWMFQYPCEFNYAYAFKIKTDSLFYGGMTRNLKFENNVLLVTDAAISSQVMTKKFVHDTFDLKTIEMLERDTVNMDCLIGRMKIVKRIQPEEGAAYDLKFPIAMPKYIDIQSKEQATVIYRKRTITLSINGMEKLFYVEKIEWNNYNHDYATAFNDHFQHKHVITIHPAEWWKGEMFSVRYVEE
ncbi:MAG: hypothetical protein HY064_03505 [Bacteroidetes bacterium]|nr:hypothetical protein [Bacteroidota bacterium]